MDIAPYGHMSWGNERQPRHVALLRMALMFPALVIVLTTAVLRSHDVIGIPLFAGVCFLIVATVLSGTPAFRRLDQATMVAIGALDLAAILVIGSLPGAAAAGALVAGPGLWLGGVLRWRGVGIVGAIGVTAIAAAEILDRSGHPVTGAEPTAWIATFGLVAAVAMASTVYVWVAQVDLLEAQQAELADALSQLEEQKQYIETIVRTVDVGLATVGADGSYTSLNPRHHELMLLAFPKGHLGRVGELGDVFAIDNQTRVERAQLPSVRALEGVTFTDTYWVGGDPATRRAIAVSASPVVGSDEAFGGAVVAYHDITSRMQALRAKDDFVAMVSHELRTPLTSIIGSLELAAILEDDGVDQLPHLMAVANRNADRMVHLIGDLLTVSQHSELTMDSAHETVEISDVVDQSVQDAAGQAAKAGVELTAEIEPDVSVMGDRGRLLQVTDNLLSNALKYTRRGGRVSVTLRRAEEGTVLTVQDTGIGVPAADQSEVFTKFFRGSNGMDLQLPGVGLGLAISKAIVEAHSGTIGLTSREGEGTTMLVTLPSAAAHGIS